MISNEPSSIVQAEVNIPVMAIHVESLAPTPGETQIEIVERKGLGHTDTICDLASWSGFHKRYQRRIRTVRPDSSSQLR